MDQYKMNLILRVAKRRYELGMSQIEIAREEHLSKSTVSRLLGQARDLGMVKISIVEPKHAFVDLENAMRDAFGLDRVTILPDVVGSRDVLRKDVCTALADDLSRDVQDGEVVGVAWGHTLSVLTEVLPKHIDKKGIKIIQLNGGLSKALYDAGADHIVRAFVHCFEGEGYLLPAPALVDTAEIAASIKSDSSVARILTLAENCRTAIYSVGTIGHGTALYQMGYFSDEAYQAIEKKSVGDVCSHFVDAQGRIADPLLDARVVATPLSKIKAVPNKMVAAVGVDKAPAILAALRGGMVDKLYIDQPAAAEVMRLASGQK
ncbi:sugar-binding transcriptional regulator [Pseudoramibacter sp.]|jgi:deoxyribonucleoside regulator|uniref:sugar-binding transcriptional regulator n=1 Tax=Pseudoramibacter sp. TaxID=2034862 RepID=UPI0025E48F4C|nr:sugar-binding domain-containing protein [Pseudoramibacter sp.]MCH4071586.1 DNA-binding transcriptional regulator [Pseudoramibacter sp.]MCH4105354.1 DNA-binding transcriptional regulator [Pseudoramibacter sp.]